MKPHLIVVLALTLLLSISSLAMAAGPGVHFFDCKECHLSGYTTSQLGGANVCLSCHNPNNAITTTMNAGNPQGYTGAVKSSGKFSEGDASNQYGNNLAPADQTSHNWAASSLKPAAGAKEPDRVLHPGLYSRYGTTVGQVACSRCHNPHGEFATNPKLMPLSADKVTPMTANATCLACHADFNKDGSLHGLVTHPVGMNYAQAVTDHPGDYKAVIDQGPAGEIALMADGTVSCTTCHGVHATDSDAGTSDGFAGAPGAGDGLLLKHNGPGKEKLAIDTGICQACHEYKGHGMSGTPLGCMVCHGGHAFDATAPNYYMLNKQVTLSNVPKTSAPGTVNLNYTALDADWQNAGAGFCESCHTLPATVAEHNTGIPQDAAFCTSCHRHDTDSGSFGGACNSCHGYAPSQNVAGGPNGYAYVDATHDYSQDANTKDESLTAHAKHAVVGAGNYSFACQECHSNFTPSPHPALDNNYQDVAFVGGLATTGGLNPAVYNKLANGTCATLYCHSDGVNTDRVIAGPIAKTVPGWLNGSTNCASCHNTGTTGTAAVHNTHLALTLDGSAVNCGTCHDDTWAAANTLKTKGDGSIVASHVDGDVDVVFNTTLVPTAPMNQVAGTCAVYCHSNGTAPIQIPDWDDAATGDCGDCHAVTAGAGLTGNHDTHLSLGFACNVCHTHDGSAFGGDHINGTKDTTLNACNACHGATAGQTVGVDRVPAWGDGTSVDCETCHSGVVAVINAASAPLVAEAAYNNGHGKVGVAQLCTDCHTAALDPNHLGGAATNRLDAGLPAYAAGNDVNFCTNCHAATTINHSALDDSVCKTCHAQHGEANGFDAMLKSTVAGNAVTGFTAQGTRDSYVNASFTGICQTCHTTQKYFSKTKFENLTHNYNSNEACSDCHTHSSTPKAFAGAGNACDACHGFPPATAAHDLHAPDSNLLPSPVLIGIDRSACASCHTGADLYTYVPSEDQASGTPGRIKHNVSEASQDATLLASVGYTGSNCTSACHDGASGVTAAWTDTSLGCNACHYQAADPTQAGNTGDANTVSAGHNAHFASGGAVVCTDCHASIADTLHITNRSGANEYLKVQGMATAVQNEALVSAGATFNTVAKTCATASCHNDARPGADVVTPAWGFDAPNCTQCHLASPTTGSHTKHIPDAANCSTCHTSALKDTSYINSNHYDGDIDVAAGSYPTDKAINSAFASCTTATCHDDGRSANTTPNWGTAAADSCVACHDAIPATGSHVSHVADAAVACADCHTGAVQSLTAPTTNHRDGNVNAGSGYPVQPKGSAFTNCTTASCHNDGRNSGVTGTWGTPINNCAECHATVPTTGGHGKHVGVSFAGAAIACTDCHAGAVQGTTAPTANHRDGNTNAAGYPVTTNGGAYQTCTTASCHQTGQAANAYTVTPAWDADTANCSQCHAASPSSGSHTKHIASVNACDDCHTAAAIKDTSYTAAAHGDGNVDVATGSYTPNKTYGAAYESCASISCHSDGFSGGAGSTPVWGTPAGCAACHLSDMTRGSHTVHLADGATCGNCHADAVKDVSAASGIHANANVDVFDVVAGDLGYPTVAAYGSASWNTCNAASCHDMGRGGLATTPAWGTTSACAECHALQPATGSHAVHIADGATCGNCHTGAVEGITDTGAAHRDTNIDTAVALGYPQNKAKNSAFTTCATASCHNDGRNSGLTGTWGTALNNCSECHATVPTTGGHGAHVGVSFGGAAIACDDCHAGAVQGTTAPSANHRDGNTNAAGYPVTTNGGAYQTCATASCHQTGQAANDYTVTPAWDANTANCSQCHAALPATGSHTKHLSVVSNTCWACHGANAIAGTSYNDANHGDLNVDVVIGGYTADKTLGAAMESCTYSCHSDGLAATGTSPIWGTATGACTACHLSDMVTGSHGAHLADGALCGDCHDGAIKDTDFGTAHTDGNVDVIATYATADAAYGAGTWTTCSAASCHDDGRAPNVTSTWGTTVNNCAECHATQPATGSHAAHLAATALGATINCGNCHTGAVEGTTDSGVVHRDGNTNATGYPVTTNGGAFQSCATINCHSNGLTATGATPVWGSAGNCATCHASNMVSGGHTVHLASGALCGDCHNGAVKDSNAGTAHIDGNVDAIAGYATANAAYGNTTWTTCNAASCHDNGTGALVTTPNWGTTSACNECHLDNMATASHTNHLTTTISANVISCGNCHADAVKATTAPTGGVHINNTLQVYNVAAGDLGYPNNVAKGGAPYSSCSTTYCHGDTLAYSVADGIDTSPLWGANLGARADNCDACHGYPPNGGGSHPASADCSACHFHVNDNDTGFTGVGGDVSRHIDGTVQIDGGDACTACHAGGAYRDPDSGDHSVHTDADTVLAGKGLVAGDYGTGAWWYAVTYDATGRPLMGCGQCHPATVSTHLNGSIQTDLDPAGETIAGNNAKKLSLAGAAYSTGTCSSVYCHSNGNGSFANVTGWDAIAGNKGITCASCHGNSPNTAAHGVHEVGIHYTELYDDDGVGLMAKSTRPVDLAASGGTDAAHGNSITSTTINCFTCHNSTVVDSANAGNSTCLTCHSDTDSIVTGNELARIQVSSTVHLNGVKDVSFADLTAFKSKAQLRDNLADAGILSTIWNRITGYKAATSRDEVQVAFATPVFTQGADTCSTVACHNGNAATWSDSGVDCMYCHTSLPK